MAICTCGNDFKQWKTTDKFCPKCTYSKLIAQNKQKPGKVNAIWNRTGKGTTQGKKSLKSADLTSKRKPSELSKAKDRAWKWFSRWIRLTHSRQGVCKCATCGRLTDIKNCDAGHFLSRTYLSTRYHPDNVRPQCKTCNRFQQGKSFEFETSLINEIGQKRVNDLKIIARIRGNDSLSYHQEVESEYKQKVENLERERGEYFWK